MPGRALHESYAFDSGSFVPVGDMAAINERIARMALLADAGDGVPSFYVDRTDGTYWMAEERENYDKTLSEVSRQWIAEHHPTVDPDRPLGDR